MNRSERDFRGMSFLVAKKIESSWPGCRKRCKADRNAKRRYIKRDRQKSTGVMKTDSNAPQTSWSYQIGPLSFFVLIFFVNFCGRMILAPLLPSIQKELGITHGRAGSFFFL